MRRIRQDSAESSRLRKRPPFKVLDKTALLLKIEILLILSNRNRDTCSKLLLARTKHAATDYEGIRIVDAADWLLGA